MLGFDVLVWMCLFAWTVQRTLTQWNVSHGNVRFGHCNTPHCHGNGHQMAKVNQRECKDKPKWLQTTVPFQFPVITLFAVEEQC